MENREQKPRGLYKNVKMSQTSANIIVGAIALLLFLMITIAIVQSV